jgi:uncharacterized membrane protein
MPTLTPLPPERGHTQAPPGAPPVADSAAYAQQRVQSLKLIGHISYLLHTLVAVGVVVPSLQVSVLLLVVAFMIDALKKPDAQGTWQASHFRWRLHSVIIAGVLYGLTTPLWLFIIPGMIAWFLISLWLLYRVLRGWIALDAGREI